MSNSDPPGEPSPDERSFHSYISAKMYEAAGVPNVLPPWKNNPFVRPTRHGRFTKKKAETV